MFGEKIKELRQSRNMTQSELGRALGVTSQSVSKWEQNTTSPDLALLHITRDRVDCKHDPLLLYSICFYSKSFFQ